LHKILYIDHSPLHGGASKSLKELITHLNSDLFHISVLCNSLDIKKSFQEKGIETYSCKLSIFQHTTAGWWKLNFKNILQFIQWYYAHYKSLKCFYKILGSIKPNIVHLNSLTLLFYLKHIKKHNIIAIIHVRESVVRGLLGFRKYLMKRIIDKFADEAIFICKDNKKSLGVQNGTIIYNPVDISKFKKQKRDTLKNKYGIKNSDKIILNVGGLRPINGPIVFVKSLKFVKETIPDFKALLPYTLYEPSNSLMSNIKRKIGNLFGYYSPRQIMDKEISTNDLKNNIIRFNYVDNIEELFIISDVVTISFTQPHFARAVLEAGAAKLPVVASNIGGVSEVVNHGVDGYLVKRGDSKELAYYLIKCLKNENKSLMMGQKAYVKVNKYFNSGLHKSRVSKLYEKHLKSENISYQTHPN